MKGKKYKNKLKNIFLKILSQFRYHNNFIEGYFGKIKTELDNLTVSIGQRPLRTRVFFQQSKLRTDKIIRLINLNIPKDRCASRKKIKINKDTKKPDQIKPQDEKEPTVLATLRQEDGWKGESRITKKLEAKQKTPTPKSYFDGKVLLNLSCQYRKETKYLKL